MSHTSRSLSILVLMIGTQVVSASTITYVVGNCKPGFPTFTTISAALAASPSPNVVLVCPDIYNEQLNITQAVDLIGVSTGDSAQAIIASPSTGLVPNGEDIDQNTDIAAQVYVNNASGPVNIEDITVDGMGSTPPQTGTLTVVGIYYYNSSGRISHVTTRNQPYFSGLFGAGVWVFGGLANPTPSVTVERSSIHDFNGEGIYLYPGFCVATQSGGTACGSLTAAITGNYINAINATNYGAGISAYNAATVKNNVIIGGTWGLYLDPLPPVTATSVSTNTFVNNSIAIAVQNLETETAISNNSIFNSTLQAISLVVEDGPFEGTMEGNAVFNSPIGIEFNCNGAINIQSNKFVEVGTALDQVPTGVSAAPVNSYFNVGTIQTPCTP